LPMILWAVFTVVKKDRELALIEEA